MRMLFKSLSSSIFAVFFALTAWTMAPASAQEVSLADQNAVQSVITDQLSAFKAQDHKRAYSHAAPSIQKIFPDINRFIGMVKGGYAPIYGSQSHNFARSRIVAGEIYQETLLTDETGKTWQAVYSLRQMADGSWKITGVKLEPYSGAST